MANDKTPKDNQENTQPQVEETQANPSNEEAEGLGKLYEENKMLVFGVLAVGIAIGVFFFLNAEEDEKENNEIVQSPSVTAYFETPVAEDNDSEQTDSGKIESKKSVSEKSKIEGFFNSPPAGIEKTSDAPALLLAAARDFDNGKFEEAQSLLKQWEAPEGYTWIKQSLEADIVSSLDKWDEARKLYDEAIESAPKDRPKIYLSLVLKDYLFHFTLKEKEKAAERKDEILAFPDHYLYFQYPWENGSKGYSLE